MREAPTPAALLAVIALFLLAAQLAAMALKPIVVP